MRYLLACLAVLTFRVALARVSPSVGVILPLGEVIPSTK
jgi:hypothetical protein